MSTQNTSSQEIEINFEDIIKTLDHIQASLFNPRISTHDDIISLMLGGNEGRPFGVNRNMLSIVRRAYGNDHFTIAAEKGKMTTDNDSAKLSESLEKIVEKTINGELENSFPNNEANEKSDNPSYFLSNSYQSNDKNTLDYEYKHILIVPMRLSQDKSIGAFIIGSSDENISFTHLFSETLDSVSNRLALCLRIVDKNHRERLQNALNHALDEHNASRFGAVKCCVDYLTKDLHTLDKKTFPKSTQPWFHENEFDILVRSPQYFEKIFWMYGDGKIQIDKSQNDTTKSLELNDLKIIAGNKSKKNDFGFEMPSSLIKVFKSKIPLVLNTRDQCERYFASHDEESIPQSCAIIPMKIKKDKSIGYFIFKNFKEKRAYELESFLLDDISDKLALIFANIRHKERSEKLVKFRGIFRQKSQTYNEEKYYIDQLTSILEDIYGKSIDFSLLIRNKKTGKIEECQTSENFLPNFSGGKERVRKIARTFILSRTNDKVSYTKDFIDINNEEEINKNGSIPEKILELVNADEEAKGLTGFRKSVIFPLHRVPAEELGFDIEEIEVDDKEDISVGCLIIKDIHLGSSDLGFIDSLTNQLALKIHQLHDRKRQELLHDFSNAIRSTENITEEKLLGLVHEYTDKIMFTDDMFVAMLKDDLSIKFPLYFEGGNSRPEIAQIAEENRFFDISSTTKGRVETILESGQAIYIKNLEESRKWYNQEGREEKIGNPYASWVGVPIWDKEKAIGVIAVYHPTEEFLYEKGDLNFLVEIADKASGLLRELYLEKANKQFEEAQKIILNQENHLTSSLLHQDLTHRIVNSLGGVMLNLNEIKGIGPSKKKEINTLSNDSIKLISNLLIDSKQIISTENTTFNLIDLLEKIIANVLSSRKVSKEVIIHEKYPKEGIPVRYNYRSLFNNIYSIIDNAAKAINKKSSIKEDDDHLFIKISVIDIDEYIKIEISDNGIKIDEKVKNNLFKLGSTSDPEGTGYGLWRSSVYFREIGGNVIFKNHSANNQKTFSITLPKSESPDKRQVAYIIDDEVSWTKIFSRWLEGIGYKVFLAHSYIQVEELVKNGTKPSIAIVDLSMDAISSTNIDGFETAKLLKNNFNDIKVLLVSGNLSILNNTSTQAKVFDATLEKITEEGEVIEKNTLLSTIKRLAL